MYAIRSYYGGFGPLTTQVASGNLVINTVYHNGMGRFKRSGGYTAFKNGSGFGQLGPVEGTDLPDAFLTGLIDSFADVRALLNTTPARRITSYNVCYTKLLRHLHNYSSKKQ